MRAPSLRHSPTALRRVGLAGVLALLLNAATATAGSESAPPAVGGADAASLQVLAERLSAAPVGPPLHRPMTLDSQVAGHVARGTIVGLIDRPLRDLRTALRSASGWCSVLVLHINNQGCRVTGSPAAPVISLRVARKYDQPTEKAYELDFAFQIEGGAGGPAMTVRLDAPKGPVGTSDYEIKLEALALDDARTLVRLGYSYRQSALTAWALELYLATVGRGKVGFSLASIAGDGTLRYIGGVRGIIERNLMRYFLAVQTAGHTPQPHDDAAYEKRLREWFDATEKYPQQLREPTRDTYLTLKAPLRGVGVVADAGGP